MLISHELDTIGYSGAAEHITNTGQRADSATGLDDYHARYYDPAAGQFTSADTVDDGLNRYGYVHGNPATYSDPSGHSCFSGDGGVCGGSSTPPLAPPPPPTDCHTTNTCPTTSGGGSVNGGGGDGGNGKACPGSCSLTTTPTGAYGCTTRMCVRDYVLRKLDSDAYIHFIVSIVLAAVAVGVAFASGNTSDAIVDGIYDLVEILSELPAAIGRVIYDNSGDAGKCSGGLRITALVQGFESTVEAFHAWWQTASWIVKAASTAAVWTLKVAAGGVIEGIKDVTLALLGGAVSLLLNSASGYELAMYNAELAQVNDQQNMDLGAWCAAYGHGECNGLTE